MLSGSDFIYTSIESYAGKIRRMREGGFIVEEIVTEKKNLKKGVYFSVDRRARENGAVLEEETLRADDAKPGN